MTPEVLNVDVFCDILISKALLTNGEEVPNDRCCRICGKIGHFIKGKKVLNFFFTFLFKIVHCRRETVGLRRKTEMLSKRRLVLASSATKLDI